MVSGNGSKIGRMIDCIFCKIAAGQIKAAIVYQDDNVVAFRDNNPQAPVHILVVPKKHIQSVAALSEADMPLVQEMHRAIQVVAKAEKIIETGFRVTTNSGKDAGQTVPHLHYHVMAGRRLTWPPG